MATVYFISDLEVKEKTPINLNVDTKLINFAIQEAQQLHMKDDILGSKLYNAIELKISNNTIKDPANINYYNLLVDYIKPAIVYWTLVECLPNIRYKIMNKSVNSQNSDNSEPVSLEEFKYLQETFTNKAEKISQNITNHLIANITFYPEYYSQSTVEDTIPQQNQYRCSMVLGDYNYLCDRFSGKNND